MHTRQPSQHGSTEVLNFRLPRDEAAALRQLADARGVKVGPMLRQLAAPLVAVAVDLGDRR